MLTAFFGVATITAQKAKPVLYIIGDSTAANKQPKAFPETGWGMEIGSFLTDGITVDNRAVNGRSTKSFINENKWQAVADKLQPGDFVLIEFGHNDEKTDKPEVGTTLVEYKANLIKFVQETQAKKANPILLTPIMRRSFKNGVFKDTHLGYPDVVRKLADSLHLPLIDMQRKTEKLIVGLGDEASKKLFNYVEPGHVNYPDGKKDDTHLSPEGAKAVAGLVAEGIKETHTDLTKYLKK
ncbi:rhamnogalacturonan acetylesterase [Pedobacter sp. KR3-3]|uniref:Rhamnogalacturonan acetylesterase n=1 Tax=Pedobacter albus TaxID=3113905 RepID=A0ABU7I5K3_9SPHI|nr:rhamnogalacturonan acetylesterase [Pedobacter sp. KR3-3]MEE1944659.1 rhamnogalacturonan acetylesterase [Pedobacter sp. KR3-3]